MAKRPFPQLTTESEKVQKARMVIERLGLVCVDKELTVPVRFSSIELQETLGEQEFFGLATFLRMDPKELYDLVREYHIDASDGDIKMVRTVPMERK